jgi:hypothetical protein
MMSFAWLRCLDRILITLGGILTVYLGYDLFVHGIVTGEVNFSWSKFVVSGQGPGLVFAAGGILVLITCARSPLVIKNQSSPGGARSKRSETLMTLSEPVDPSEILGGPGDPG